MVGVTQLQRSNGGVCTHVISLCEGLLQKGHKVVLIADEKDNNYTSEILALEQKGLKFYSLPFMKAQADKKELIKITYHMLSLAKKEEIDVLHSHGQMICIIGIIMRFLYGIPFVWTNHIDEVAQPKIFKIILHSYKFPIISVSTDLKKYLIGQFHVQESRIDVINNGINICNFGKLQTNEREKLKESIGITDEYVVSLLARITFGKGHSYLLEAVNIVQKKHPEIRIKVLFAGELYDGHKSYLQEQLTFAEKHGIDLAYLGFQSPRDIFGISDISVLPSIYEGFGMTCIESLAMGCPVIRSDTPGWSDMKDILTVVPKANIEALADSLEYAIMNRHKMCEKAKIGKSYVAQKFSAEHMVDETIFLYKKILC
ncbi:MAG: glycosyltransferase family 4 protein [Lachnospiraceae bacterium]|nr:glycosyltransferase family 4 protein [Lachnospiraceae bacterium]